MPTTQRSKRSRLKFLDQLPVELWEAILHHASQPSRMRLSWSSRVLRHATIKNPSLWTDFRFPAGSDQVGSQPCPCSKCSPTNALPSVLNRTRVLNTTTRLEAFLERSHGQPFHVWLYLFKCPLGIATVHSILQRSSLLPRMTRLEINYWSENLDTYLLPLGLNRFTSVKTLELSCSWGAREPNPMPSIIASGLLSETVTTAKLPPITRWYRSWGPFPAMVQLDIVLLDFHQLNVALMVMPSVKDLRACLADDAMTAQGTHALVPMLRQQLTRLTKLRVESSEPVLSWMTQNILAPASDSPIPAIQKVGLYGSECQDGCLRLLSELSDDIKLQLAIVTTVTGFNNTVKHLSITVSNTTGRSRELRFWLSDVLRNVGWFFRRLLPYLHRSRIEHLSVPWTMLQRFSIAVPVELPGTMVDRLPVMPMLHSITFLCNNPRLSAPLPSATVRSILVSVCAGRVLDVLDLRGLRTQSWKADERADLLKSAKMVHGLSRG